MTDPFKELSKEDIRQALSLLLTPEELKQVNKEAIKEFLKEEKASLKQSIGEWFINTALILLVGAMAYFTLNQMGWKGPHN